MRAHHIMTRDVVTVTPDTSIFDAANLMLQHHVSGLPVVSDAGKLVGVVSEGDFLHRAETGTRRRRPRWLDFFTSPGGAGDRFVHEHGRKVGDVMTRDTVTASDDATLDDVVRLMEQNNVKRLPVMRGDTLVGIVTRANLLRTVASLAREIPDPTADDAHIRRRIIDAVRPTWWRPIGFDATVRNGIVHLHGIVVDDRARQAAMVAAENVPGVKKVHDHLCWVDGYSGFYLESPEDQEAAG
jgi:CBS domain-containing protein